MTECQELVMTLMLAIENQYSSPNSPRRVVELWSILGETCGSIAEPPYDGVSEVDRCDVICARQNQYRVFLGDILYEKITNSTACRIPLTFSESIRVAESVSRNRMDDVEVLYPLLSLDCRSEYFNKCAGRSSR